MWEARFATALRLGRYRYKASRRIPFTILALACVLSAIMLVQGCAATGLSKPSKVAFARNNDIWVMNSDGSRQINLTKAHKTTEAYPSWSPDGERIAFIKGENIWIMRSDGKSRTKVTSYKNGCIAAAAWSPDGKQIAFIRADEDLKKSDILIIEPSTRKARSLAFRVKGRANFISWSPNGRRVAVSTDKIIGSATIYTAISVYDLEKDNTTIISRGYRVRESDPAWSPDGKQIAFIRWDGAKSYLMLMTPEGSGRQILLTVNKPSAIGHPVWASNGQQILYNRWKGLQGRGEIWAVDPKTKKTRRLINNGWGPACN